MVTAIRLLALVAASWLTANTVDAVLSFRWELPPSPLSAPGGASAMPAPRPLDDFLGPIRGRNVFRHGEAVPDEEPIPLPAEPVATGACTLPVRLLSALIVPDAPSRSLGVWVEDGTSGERLQVVQVGEKLGDLGTLRAVREELSEDNLRLLPVVELLTPEGRVQVCRGVSGAAPPATTLPAPTGVRRLSDTRMEVDRKLVEHVLAGGLGDVAQQVLVTPWVVDGRPSGFRFNRIQAGSLVAQIGLQEGDVVQKINGYPTSNVEEILRVYQTLRNETEIAVNLTRNGQPVTLSYAVR